MIKQLRLASLAVATLAISGMLVAAPATQQALENVKGRAINCPSGMYTVPTAPAVSNNIATVVFMPSNHATKNSDVSCLQKEIATKLKVNAPAILCKEDTNVGKGAVICRFSAKHLNAPAR